MSFIQRYQASRIKVLNQPIRVDSKGKATFTKNQIDIFGFPTNHSSYEVIDNDQEYTLSYEDEENLKGQVKKVHRYSRTLRFRTLLFQLLNCVGFENRLSKEYIEEVKENLPDNIIYTPPSRIWETLRTHLKGNNRRIFYNRIPALAADLDLFEPYNIRNSTRKVNDILRDFDRLQKAFPDIKKDLDRKYFPSLRFIALKLFEKHDVELPFPIPKMRTAAKEELLEQDWIKLWEAVELDDFAEELEASFY
jgi:hypothetical protein